MKRLFKYRYPKLTLLIILVAVAYYLFTIPTVVLYLSSLGNLKYWGILIAGLLFSFGFSTPFAVGLFLTLKPDNILLAAIIGGAGAMLSDLSIFSFIRLTFMDEFQRLEKVKPVAFMEREFHQILPKRLQRYLLYACAGFIIASPLPDELGVTLLSGFSTIKTRSFILFSFIFNALGIFLMFLLGKVL
ncbi:hypothetical protein KW805_01360 [Candidatus Pacearchaeota archaeon]|nr:hypothetical protein [Candidatus Pacearchaeota archaeon]